MEQLNTPTTLFFPSLISISGLSWLFKSNYGAVLCKVITHPPKNIVYSSQKHFLVADT